MGSKAVGQWHTLRVKFGGFADGVPEWDAAWTVVLGKRRTNARENVQKVDVTALEDANKFYQPTFGDGAFDFDVLVPTAGRVFKGKRGFFLQIEVQETATAAPVVHMGFIEEVSYTADDGPQVETVRFQPGANGAGN